jgi:hypothetical protein
MPSAPSSSVVPSKSIQKLALLRGYVRMTPKRPLPPCLQPTHFNHQQSCRTIWCTIAECWRDMWHRVSHNTTPRLPNHLHFRQNTDSQAHSTAMLAWSWRICQHTDSQSLACVPFQTQGSMLKGVKQTPRVPHQPGAAKVKMMQSFRRLATQTHFRQHSAIPDLYRHP